MSLGVGYAAGRSQPAPVLDRRARRGQSAAHSSPNRFSQSRDRRIHLKRFRNADISGAIQSPCNAAGALFNADGSPANLVRRKNESLQNVLAHS